MVIYRPDSKMLISLILNVLNMKYAKVARNDWC